jgi:hypothetical protein
MDWSAKRQLIIVSKILLILVFVVSVVSWYFVFSKDPDCFDGKKNGDEAGLDCGGSCQLVCKDQARNPVVLWKSILPITDNTFAIGAYIENANASAGVYALKYRFKLFDETHNLISEHVDYVSVYPASRTLVVADEIFTDKKPSEVFFEVDPVFEWMRTPERFSKDSVLLEGSIYDDSGFSPKVTATARNVSFEDVYDTTFIALLYDRDENVVGYSHTYVEKLLHGDVVPLVFTWPDFFDVDVFRFEVVPQINIFNEKNYKIGL